MKKISKKAQQAESNQGENRKIQKKAQRTEINQDKKQENQKKFHSYVRKQQIHAN